MSAVPTTVRTRNESFVFPTAAVIRDVIRFLQTHTEETVRGGIRAIAISTSRNVKITLVRTGVRRGCHVLVACNTYLHIGHIYYIYII